MKLKIMSVGVVLAFIAAVTACDPPDTGSEPAGEEAQAQEVSEDGPDDIDDGGITEISDDADLVEEGEKLFASQGCTGCHKMDEELTGPALGDVTERRTAPWIAKMIMDPVAMTERDPTAKSVSQEFAAEMIDTNVSPEQAEAIIAFLGAQ